MKNKNALYKTYRRPYHRKAFAPHHYSHGGSSHYPYSWQIRIYDIKLFLNNSIIYFMK